MLVTCAVALQLVVQPAWAAGGEIKQAEAKALEAKAYFKRGLYVEAAEIFMQAYAIAHAPDAVYNAARAYEEAKEFKRAVALFEMYLSVPGVSENGKRDARAHIDGLNQHLQVQAERGATSPEAQLPAVKPQEVEQPKAVTLPAGALDT